MTFPQCEIVFEDEYLLVVNKRANLATMGVDHSKPSLVAEIRHYLQIKECDTRPFVGVVGRLDFPVCGLLVIAKNTEVAHSLNQQQKNGELDKTYHALVSGRVAATKGNLVDWLLKSKRHRSVSVVAAETAGSQIAKLHYRALCRRPATSLLSIGTQTGRKHQIRAQLNQFGHAILGDRKYGSQHEFPAGIALICKQIRFTHPITRLPFAGEISYPRRWYASIHWPRMTGFCD